MAEIFISYRRADSLEIVEKIHRKLEAAFGQGAVFHDRDDINPGEKFPERILREIMACRVMLVVIGEKWTTLQDESGKRRLDDVDDWVRTEIETALRNIDKKVIPVLINHAPMPKAEEMPSRTLKELVERQGISISDALFEQEMDKFIFTLQQLISPTKTPKQLYPLEQPITKSNRLKPYQFGAIALLLMVLAGIGWWLNYSNDNDELINEIVMKIVLGVAEPQSVENSSNLLIRDYLNDGNYAHIADQFGETKDEQDILIQANSYLFAGCYEQAIEKYNMLVDTSYEALALNNRAIAYLHFYWHETLDESFVSPQCERTLVLDAAEAEAQAIKDFEKVIEISDGTDMEALAYVNLGIAYYFFQNKFDDAANVYCNADARDFPQYSLPEIKTLADLCKNAAIIYETSLSEPLDCTKAFQNAEDELLALETSSAEKWYWLSVHAVTQARCEGVTFPDIHGLATVQNYREQFVCEIANDPTSLAISRSWERQILDLLPEKPQCNN